ncbi:MAG TPA: hypothetical protein VGL78_00455 [Solirubrobacteraceae bacterium]
MFYLDFLRGLHERLAPRTYLEIGVAQGHSLALSRCRSVGIDPVAVDQELLAPTSLLRCTSVFRIGPALAANRPDLRLLMVATEPTGTLLVTQLDPSSRVLQARLDDIVRDHVQPNPQSLPREVMERTHAIAAEDALALKLWKELRDARNATPAAR